jgi:3-oxoacyl-[acyl-carrier protein] reductase
MDFLGKNVLITGGSRGIGRATAIAFAEAGARVAINFKNSNASAGATIEAMPGEGHFAVKADISNPAAAQQLINAVVDEFQQLDILVNNAGVYLSHPVDGSNYDDWQSAWQYTLATNLIGPANLCYCAAQHMIRQQGGRIVNVSSRGAFRGEPQHTAYGASKAGLNALGQSLAQELAPHNIFVGTVAPGFVATDMAQAILDSDSGEEIRQQSPLNRVATPEEVAHAILFLASEKAAFTTGCILDLNGASYLRS